MRIRSQRCLAVAATAILAAGVLSAVTSSAHAEPAPVTVTVNPLAGLADVPSTGRGTNHAIWDSELGSTAVSDLLRKAGVQMLRYPGGSYADIYHWEDHTAPGGYVAPGTDFDTFMAGAKRVGAQPIVIANYGTGTAEEAAEWVRYANVTKHYRVKYWEIGNENYGNGHYGSAWEADDHEDKSPTAYANGVVAYADAMKKVDPGIRIGAVLTTPGAWPDGLVAEGDSATWNDTVLSIAGSKIDFVILHWYPSNDGGSGIAGVLARTDQIEDILYLTRKKIAKHAGARADRIGIAMTEINSGVGTTTQPGALFLADAYPALMAGGVFTVDWWNVHNGIGTVTTVAGQTDYGDWGILSSGGCTEDGTCEPALNTPFAPYHALTMMSDLTRPGDQLVRAGSDDRLVVAHAARRANGDLAVLLLNEDPDEARTVTLDYVGFTPAAEAPLVSSFTNGAASITRGRNGNATSRTLPPYSLTTLVLRPARRIAGAPGAPCRPAAGEVGDSSATVSWSPSRRGRLPVAGYDVYRQDGAKSVLLGSTKSTSLTVTGLEPGTRYTLNVVARDTAGNLSPSSQPLVLETGTPEDSTCAVHLADVNDWGNGYVGSIDITNKGAEPIDGWTLGFSWPRSWQSFGSGWSGTWTAEGSSVSVVNTDYNQTIPPGGSVNTGFVGNYGGPNVLPNLFTLNGTLCTTIP